MEVGGPAVIRELAARRAINVVVLEPALVSSEAVAPLLASLAGPPQIPLVLYTAISPAAMRGTVEFARAGVRHVVLRGFDDGPRRFRALLEELASGRWESALHAQLVRERIERAPAPLALAVERLFNSPQEFRTVDDLARTAGMHRRNLERGLARTGLGSARLLLASARVERAFALLRQEGHSVEAVARILGAPTTRTFVREVKWVTGRAPGVLRHAVTAEELVRGLVTRLTAEASRHPPVVSTP